MKKMITIKTDPLGNIQVGVKDATGETTFQELEYFLNISLSGRMTRSFLGLNEMSAGELRGRLLQEQIRSWKEAGVEKLPNGQVSLRGEAHSYEEWSENGWLLAKEFARREGVDLDEVITTLQNANREL